MKLLRSPAGVAVDRGEVLPPLVLHTVLGIGLNYRAHAVEQGSPIPERPVVFSKNVAALAISGEEIVIPKVCQDREQVDWEGELAVVIGAGPGGRPCRDVAEAEALRCVFGYAAANDVSARWWQKQGSGGQFWRGKSFDTFCPLSAVTPAAAVPDPQALRLITRVNGQTMQDGSTSDMIFPVAKLVAELSRGLTLLPGTVIVTGTPSGVGMARSPQVFLKSGDVVEVEIPGVGSTSNRVRAE